MAVRQQLEEIWTCWPGKLWLVNKWTRCAIAGNTATGLYLNFFLCSHLVYSILKIEMDLMRLWLGLWLWHTHQKRLTLRLTCSFYFTTQKERYNCRLTDKINVIHNLISYLKGIFLYEGYSKHCLFHSLLEPLQNFLTDVKASDIQHQTLFLTVVQITSHNVGK